MNLTDYRTLGRSGLIISPFALGTMTFGAGRWGTSEAGARAIFDAYVEAGGNFIDTADLYSGGRSEEMLGGFIADKAARDRLVLATKSGFPRGQGTPLHGGNGAKNIRLAIESSLKRLRTDYIDMYWMHVWDRTTPVEEVLRTLTDAVAAGKILHYGFSNTPAWYVARIATLAEAHGLPRPIGLQYGYSLLDRAAELELGPVGRELGLGMVPWSPLAAGLLTGKYGRDMIGQAGRTPEMPSTAGKVGTDGEHQSDGRLNGDNPFGSMLFTDRNFDVIDVLRAVAMEVGRSMAEVALAWLIARPGVSSVLIGASRPEQLHENLKALEITLSPGHAERLDQASALALLNPYFIFDLPREAIFGGQKVQPWQA